MKVLFSKTSAYTKKVCGNKYFFFHLYYLQTNPKVALQKNKKKEFLSMYIPFFLIVDQKATAVWKNQQNTSNEKGVIPSLFQDTNQFYNNKRQQKFLE